LPELAALRLKLEAESGKAIEVKVDAPQTTYDRNYARTQEIQQRSRTAKIVVRRSDRQEEMTRQGRLRYYLNRTVLHDTVLKDWNVFTHELRTRSGKHRHQGGLVIYVIDGKGYTVVESQRLDWESGDLILLPIQPGGVEHQHFNLNGDTPSRWMAYIYKPFHDEVAHGMEQREESPEYNKSDK
jgi:quercetin dioxygenase-like cupin family protein